MPAIARLPSTPARPRDGDALAKDLSGAAAAPTRKIYSECAEVRIVSDIANAVMRARAHDPEMAALGLLVIVEVLAGDDPLMRTTLALAMVRAALDLDADVASVTWQ